VTLREELLHLTAAILAGGRTRYYDTYEETAREAVALAVAALREIVRVDCAANQMLSLRHTRRVAREAKQLRRRA